MPKNMSTSKGELTGVVYGYATTLIKVLEDLNPKYVAASFDLSGPTFRHKEYKEYKATRVKADQELYDQIPKVRELVETMGIPIYEKEGFEADDVIGTISSKNHDKVEIYIVSGDKDIFQLVNGNVKIYNLKKGLSQTQIIDKDIILKDYNLQPEDFIDLKALAGDASDNIPGVPGIGQKTATSLIIDFDTLDKLYQCVGDYLVKNDLEISNSKFQKPNKFQIPKTNGEKIELKSRIIRLLIEYKDQAYLSQKLATIHKDVPVNFSLEDSLFGEYDRGKLKQFFEELGFRSLLKRYGASDSSDEPNIKNQSTADQPKAKKDKQLKLL